MSWTLNQFFFFSATESVYYFNNLMSQSKSLMLWKVPAVWMFILCHGFSLKAVWQMWKHCWKWANTYTLWETTYVIIVYLLYPLHLFLVAISIQIIMLLLNLWIISAICIKCIAQIFCLLMDGYYISYIQSLLGHYPYGFLCQQGGQTTENITSTDCEAQWDKAHF